MVHEEAAMSQSLGRASTVAPDVGFFSNNNYMPGIGQYNALRQVNPEGALGMQNIAFLPTGGQIPPLATVQAGFVPLTQTCSVGSSQNGFTFTSPTQFSGITAPLTPGHPNYGVLSSPSVTQNFAPGNGAPWQHIVPSHIPWASSASSMSSQAISTFTAPVMCSQTMYPEPIASCSRPVRRPKRHAGDLLHGHGPATKVHLTEEKIAAHMQELQINCPYNQNVNDGMQASTNIAGNFVATEDITNIQGLNNNAPGHLGANRRVPVAGARQLKEIEDSLELSEDEDSQEDMSASDRQPKLHLLEGLEPIISPEPIIPKQILDEINKPKLEVVLWQPPGGKVDDRISNTSPHRGRLKDEESTGDQRVPNTDSNIVPDMIASSSGVYNYGMDTDVDFTDQADDDMQL